MLIEKPNKYRNSASYISHYYEIDMRIWYKYVVIKSFYNFIITIKIWPLIDMIFLAHESVRNRK